MALNPNIPLTALGSQPQFAPALVQKQQMDRQANLDQQAQSDRTRQNRLTDLQIAAQEFENASAQEQEQVRRAVSESMVFKDLMDNGEVEAAITHGLSSPAFNKDFKKTLKENPVAAYSMAQTQIRLAEGMGVLRGGGDAPSSVREYLFFESLTPEQQETFMTLQRGPEVVNLGDRTEVLSQVNPNESVASRQRGVSPERQPENVAAAEAAGTEARMGVERAFSAGQAQNQLNAVVDKSNTMLTAIDNIANHPGLDAAVGFSAVANPANIIPGTEAYDAKVLIQQLKDRVFADAIQAMRDASKTGGAVGSVSDAEGRRLENMFGALERSQSEKQFKQQLQLIRDTVTQSINRVQDAYQTQYGDFEGSGDPELDAILRAIEEQSGSEEESGAQ